MTGGEPHDVKLQAGAKRPPLGLEMTLAELVRQQAEMLQMQRELKTFLSTQHESFERQWTEQSQIIGQHFSRFEPMASTPNASHALMATSMNTNFFDLERISLDHHCSGCSVASDTGPANTDPSLRETSTYTVYRGKSATHGSPKKEKLDSPPIRTGPWEFITSIVTSTRFETAVGVLISLDFLKLFMMLQIQGFDLARKLQMHGEELVWPRYEDRFEDLEQIFSVLYICELLLRFSIFRGEFCRDFLNLCDAVVILLSSVDTFILDFVLKETTFLRHIRLLRSIRLLRLLRVLRLMGMFSSLHLLVNTIRMSLGSLCWSMAVVGFIIFVSGMLMVQFTNEFIADETQKWEARHWVFLHFGSATRAIYTMFEATFSGKWATILSRPMIENVSGWFSLFWIVYTVLINFAAMRIMSALFVKQTMDVAKIDAERAAYIRMEEREKVLVTLRNIFRLGDTSGDGFLHKEEFEAMMEKQEVLDMFQEIELAAPELSLLFNLLSEDDGAADQDEFLFGALHLKNPVQTMDIIQVLHEQMVMKRAMKGVREDLQTLGRLLQVRLGMPQGPSEPQAGRLASDPTSTEMVKKRSGRSVVTQNSSISSIAYPSTSKSPEQRHGKLHL